MKEVMLTDRSVNQLGNNISKSRAFNPNDVMRTTTKEQTIYPERAGFMASLPKTYYIDPKDVPRTTVKEMLVNQIRTSNLSQDVSRGSVPVQDK